MVGSPKILEHDGREDLRVVGILQKRLPMQDKVNMHERIVGRSIFGSAAFSHTQNVVDKK